MNDKNLLDDVTIGRMVIQIIIGVIILAVSFIYMIADGSLF